MDVTKEEEVKEMVETTMSTYGRINILVNNAGILQDKRFEDLTVKDWYEVMSVHGLGYLLTMWEVLPIMKKQGSGCIINVSSISATRPWETQPFYCFVKAGMNHLTRCLNNEYAGYGIRINSLAPGLVLTEMTKDGPLNELSKGIPMKRYATSDEIAGSALFLASKDASYISGSVINIDGGLVS
jgi:NAD(P)-dependent dehydrogenase (short-subunit alcohol dehydrogenase family)